MWPGWSRRRGLQGLRSGADCGLQRSTHLAGLLHVLRRHGGLLGGRHSHHPHRQGAAGLQGKRLRSARLGGASQQGPFQWNTQLFLSFRRK